MNYKGIKDKIHVCQNCKGNIPFKTYGNGNLHKFCNSKCSGEFRSKKSKERFERGEIKNRGMIYNYICERDGNKCSVCRINKWNGTTIRFWVDHIDGNAANNVPNNFRLICPNCDSQSPTFGNHNKGKGRRSLGLKPYE